MNFKNVFFVVKNDNLIVFFHRQLSYLEETQSKFNVVTNGSFRAFCEICETDFFQTKADLFLQQVEPLNPELLNKYADRHVLIDELGTFYFYQ